jgi:hypothetical protein
MRAGYSNSNNSPLLMVRIKCRAPKNNGVDEK